MTIVCKQINKLRGDNGSIEGYILQDESNKTLTISSDELKEYIKNGTLNVTNLTLTSDNRLVDAAVGKFDELDKARVPQFKDTEKHDGRIAGIIRPKAQKKTDNALFEDFNRIYNNVAHEVGHSVVSRKYRNGYDDILIIEADFNLFYGNYIIRYKDNKLNVTCIFSTNVVKLDRDMEFDYLVGRLNANTVTRLCTFLKNDITKIRNATGKALTIASKYKSGNYDVTLIDEVNNAIYVQLTNSNPNNRILTTVRSDDNQTLVSIRNYNAIDTPSVVAWNYGKYEYMPFRLMDAGVGKIAFADKEAAEAFKISRYLDLALVAYNDTHCIKPHLDANKLIDDAMRAFKYMSYNPFEYVVNYTNQGFDRETFVTSATVNGYTDDGCDLTVCITHNTAFKAKGSIILTNQADGIRIEMEFNPFTVKDYSDVVERFGSMMQNRRPGRYVKSIYDETI